jgi:uncharacterized phage-associated protein
MAKLTARDVADYFLASVRAEVGDNISNLKLQKLLYYAQGLHLAMRGTPLFDDPILAWQYGPVVRSIYDAFRQHGAGAIPRPEDFDPDKFDLATREVLDETLMVYGQYSALRLMELTHAEPPWQDTDLNGVISLESMTNYFRTQLI